jgi:glycosyltransferase involved in cell wall biosynthesis
MRILHLIPRLQRRGAEVFAVELFQALSAEGLSGKLAVLFNGPDELGISDNPDVCRLQAGSGLAAVGRLRSLIAGYSPDIILAHGGGPLKYAVLSAGTDRKPSLLYRKIGLSRDWFGQSAFLKLPFYRWLTGHAAFVSCVGEESRREAVDLFRIAFERTRVIYRGVDASRFIEGNGVGASIRHSLDIRTDTIVLICVGAISREKNLGAVLRLTAGLRRKGDDIVLLLAGRGPLESELRSLASDLGISKQVLFLVVREDIPSLLQASDILLLTSLTEGVPGALIEAGLAGIPAVAWDVGGVKEVILHGKTGMVTPCRDENTFLEAVNILVGDEGMRRRMGKAARDFCLERFDIKRSAREHIKLFEDMVSKSS